MNETRCRVIVSLRGTRTKGRKKKKEENQQEKPYRIRKPSPSLLFPFLCLPFPYAPFPSFSFPSFAFPFGSILILFPSASLLSSVPSLLFLFFFLLQVVHERELPVKLKVVVWLRSRGALLLALRMNHQNRCANKDNPNLWTKVSRDTMTSFLVIMTSLYLPRSLHVLVGKLVVHCCAKTHHCRRGKLQQERKQMSKGRRKEQEEE